MPHQSRCYVKDRNSDLYRIGRILQWFDGEYEVHFPDQDAGFYSEEDIFTRCNQPLEDPLEVLIHKGHDTPFFHDKRRSLFDMFINQRGFAHGMTGLISSKIELYPHQVEVIRRVLEDPIQRYLLADEVGLGKTIEAGVILRQYLLDYSVGKVLVLAPPFLVQQWDLELKEKFQLDLFEDRVEILSTDKICLITETLDFL